MRCHGAPLLRHDDESADLPVTEHATPIEHFITTQLESHHDRAAFSCGNAPLDNYLHDCAVSDATELSKITFVLVDLADQRTMHGYCSLSSTSIQFGAVPASVTKQLRISRHRAMSATLIGRLAVSNRLQGKRIGEELLFDALKRAYIAAQQVGSALAIAHAIDADAERFYKTFGFVALENIAHGLFLTTATVAPLLRLKVALDGCTAARQI